MNSLIHIFKCWTWLFFLQLRLWESRGGSELNYAGSGQLNQAEDSASRVSVMCSQNSFCFLKKIENVCRRMDVNSPSANRWYTPIRCLCVKLARKPFCFSGCTFELLKICLWKLTDMLFPSSYKSSEEEAFHCCSFFSSVCSVDVAVGFTCTAFSCHCLCSSERLGEDQLRSHRLNLLEIKRVEQFGSLSGLECSHPGSQSLVIVLMWWFKSEQGELLLREFVWIWDRKSFIFTG